MHATLLLLCVSQVDKNGAVQVGTEGMHVSAGGLSVVVGGMTVATGGASPNFFDATSLYSKSGALSVTSTTANTATLDVYSTSSSFTGNLIFGTIAATSNANLLLLNEGSNNLLRVRVHVDVDVVVRVLRS